MTTTLQKERLFEIAKYTQTPTKTRRGFNADWHKAMVKQLIALDLVTVKFGSVVLTDKGWQEIGE